MPEPAARSFYVGEAVDPEKRSRPNSNTVSLKLFVPKKEAKPAVEDHKYIAIEG